MSDFTGENTQAREQAITDRVLASFDSSGSQRFADVMQSLVRHLHAFVREVRLTEGEWEAAIDFLTRTGQTCTDRRQEFVLLSDVLGASMLTVTVNEAPQPAATESTVFGPFFVAGSPEVDQGGNLAGTAPGRPCWVDCRLVDTEGDPVAGARIEVWEADAEGLYDVQYGSTPDAPEGPRTAGRGHLFTDQDGRFRFWSVLPTAYPIPTDGPVGELLGAAGRDPMRPAHIHFMITASGYRRLVTHVFAAGDPHLADDAVFGVKQSLVARFEARQPHEVPQAAAQHAPAAARTGAWSSLEFQFVLALEPPGS